MLKFKAIYEKLAKNGQGGFFSDSHCMYMDQISRRHTEKLFMNGEKIVSQLSHCSTWPHVSPVCKVK